MSYTITISGHGATEESVHSVVQAALNTLGESGAAYGQYSGSDKDGQPFEGKSAMVPQAEPKDVEADPA